MICSKTFSRSRNALSSRICRLNEEFEDCAAQYLQAQLIEQHFEQTTNGVQGSEQGQNGNKILAPKLEQEEVIITYENVNMKASEEGFDMVSRL